MTRFKRADLSRIRTISIKDRKSKVRPRNFAGPIDARKDSFRQFVDGMPDVLQAQALRRLVRDVVNARTRSKPVVLMMGAHVIKVGLAPLIIVTGQSAQEIDHAALKAGATDYIEKPIDPDTFVDYLRRHLPGC